MPTYTNSTSVDLWGSNPHIKFPAKTTKASTLYVQSLPGGVTLTSHEPVIQPWQLIAPVNGIIDVSPWENIIVYNTGDEAASISANTDDDNALIIPANAQQIFDNTNRLFGCLEVLSGTASVWGTR